MLIHHDRRPYAEVAAEGAARATAKMEGLIAAGSGRMEDLIKEILRDQPRDFLVDPAKLAFNTGSESELRITWPEDGEGDDVDALLAMAGRGVHRNALHQLAQKTGGVMSVRQINACLDPSRSSWAVPDVLANNFNQCFGHSKSDNVLLRCVANDDSRLQGKSPRDFDVRAVLSDRYARLDSGLILGRFMQETRQFGIHPVSHHYNGLRWYIKAYLGEVFEPVPNEPVMFGIALSNSEFGVGSLNIQPIMMRMWCTNEAIGETALRRVHLGSRMDGERFGNETHKLNSQTIASQLADIIGNTFAEKEIDRRCAIIKCADDMKLDVKEIEQILKDEHKRAGLPKHIYDQLVTAYREPSIELLPAGDTLWRLAQTFGLVANRSNGEEARPQEEVIKLQEAADRVLQRAAKVLA